MKIILWRISHDCLPTGFQLCRRHIPATDTCIFCNRVERVEHTFLFCSYAEEVWEAIKDCYGIHLQRRFFLSPRQWLFDVLERCSGVQTTAITLTFWHLWKAKNDARNNNCREDQGIC
jgi:hypothetical protein